VLGAAASPTEPAAPAEAMQVPAIEAVAAAFPQLEILEFIGKGGMGLVYKARQPKLDRLVALKLLPRTAGADPSFGERFNREARVLARLSHPNIVAVHDFGQAGDFYYLLMEYVDGVNLRQSLRGGKFTQAQALSLVPKICDALQYAHEEGVLHRDIKPENLLLDTRGRIKIADFGIAKLQGELKGVTLTASGAAVGTPHYMAPEQLERPQEVDQRADIYSLGVVFYEMLTGELPLGRFAPPSAKSEVDPRVDEVVLRTLEKERERRFQSAGEVKTRVENITAATASDAGGTPASSGTLSPDVKWRWSRCAQIGAVLGAIGLLIMLQWFPHGMHRGLGEEFVLWMGTLAVSGIIFGRLGMRAIQASQGRLRGRLLAMFAVAAWLLVGVNLAVFTVFGLVSVIVHARVLDLLFELSLLGVNGYVIWHWLTRWPQEDTLLPHREAMEQLRRVPRRWWQLGIGALVICLVAGGLARPRAVPSEPEPSVPVPQPPGYPVASAASSDAPSAPHGYEAGSGDIKLGEHYLSTLTVPAGYAMTVSLTLWSNQTQVLAGGADSSAVVLAPAGGDVSAAFNWKTLGITRLADGAPLECSLRLQSDQNPQKTLFYVMPPVDLVLGWGATYRQLWPPLNGFQKYLLLKGTSQGEDAAEWLVGVEVRLDPLPAEAGRRLQQPLIQRGTNWLAALTPGAETAGHGPAPQVEDAAPQP
jgi:tRNA A-37 threonylcarbamoyl transferase component Bud32